MPRVLAAVAVLAFTIYCVVDAVQTDDDEVRGVPKLLWLVMILLFPLVGGAAWLVAGRGDPEAGLRDVQVALDQMASLGALPWVTYAYALRAEILMWCGDVEQARRAITDAASGASLESDPYGPEVLRIHAEILAAAPHTADGAQAVLDEGLRLAAEQGAGCFASRLRAVRLRMDAR